MGIYGGEDSLVENFSSRFEADGEGFLFRSNLRAAPIPVSIVERDEEVSRYQRSMRLAMAGFLVVSLAAFSTLIGIDIAYDIGGLSWMIWLVLIPLIGGFAFVSTYLWRVPDRRFAGRIPATNKFSIEEVRRRTFEHISWVALAITPFIALLILMPRRGEEMSDLGFMIKLGVAGALILLAAVQAFRKWRFERNKR